LKRKEALPAGMGDYLVSCVDLADCMRLEGASLNKRDVLESARTLLDETLPQMESLFSKSDPRTLSCVICLASVHEYLGNVEKAETYFSEALIIYKDVEANPLEKLSCQLRLAYNRFVQNKYRLAERQQCQCICISNMLTSIDHATTLKATIDWARSLIGLGRLDEAGNLLVFALEEKIRQNSFDRSMQAAWAGLGEVSRLLEERGITEKALLVKIVKQKYDLAILSSLLRQGRVSDEGLSLPEYGITLPIQVLRIQATGEGSSHGEHPVNSGEPSDTVGFESGPSQPN
jgi:tetratricopeptide (TPR) repeat protein